MEKIRDRLNWDETLANAGLGDIHRKVLDGERLSYDDGVLLFELGDPTLAGYLANIIRERKNGNRAYFIRNQHINHTNICRNKCRFCAFYREKGQEGAYQMTIDEIFAEVERHKNKPFTEIHIVGGLNPDLTFEYFTEMFSGIKRIRPEIHVQALTCVEVAWLAEITGMSVKETLIKLKESGLDSIPGGGAEVFSETLRAKYWPNKLAGDEWLEVAGEAHRLGIPTNATILYGHKETYKERVHHLVKLREQQDKTGGFIAFIPLAFHSHNTDLTGIPRTTGRDDLMMMAVSRLMLDNFDHIKAFWIMLTPEIAALSLNYGADDIDGTVTEEKITHMAGAETPTALTVDELLGLIHDAGRDPTERDTVYNIVKEY
jgi:aminodeoxyfutalosine synthase